MVWGRRQGNTGEYPPDSGHAVHRYGCYDVPVGEVWSRESIAKLKKQVEDAGLGFDVIESIPVHEDIKLGKASRDKYIENYCENIRRVAEAGVKCICYNFMPVFDWTRTERQECVRMDRQYLLIHRKQ